MAACQDQTEVNPDRSFPDFNARTTDTLAPHALIASTRLQHTFKLSLATFKLVFLSNLKTLQRAFPFVGVPQAFPLHSGPIEDQGV